MNSTKPTSITEACKLSNASLAKLSKAELLKIIQTAPVSTGHIDYPTRDPNANADLLVEIENIIDRKFKSLEQNLAARIDEIELKVETVTNEVKSVVKDHTDLRLKLATLESKLHHSTNQLRRQNFIVKGISEQVNPVAAASSVIEALQLGQDFKALGATITSAYRLGKPRGDDSPSYNRP